MVRLVTLTAVLLFTPPLTGCVRNEAAPAPQAAPRVTVAQVISKEVTDFDEFTGRFEAVERVQVRPRVAGYITEVRFTEGHEVKKGDVLFVIDQRPYEAEVKRAKADLDRAHTQLQLARSERDRATKLLEVHALSREEFDTRSASHEQADANVAAAQAALDIAALNLTFTQVRSPIAGLASRAQITPGNLVTAGDTILTTVVSMNPIYVAFDGDEQVYLKYLDMARRGERGSSRTTRNPVWIGLGNEAGHPHQGVMVFVDNEIDANTGTIHARGLFDNPDHMFTPGMFARVKLTGSGRYNAVLVNDSAIGTDQSVKYVLLVGKDNAIEYRSVQLGPIVDGLRVVRSGLNPGDTIVVNGLHRVHPGSQVIPQLVAMGTRDEPTRLAAQSNGSAP